MGTLRDTLHDYGLQMPLEEVRTRFLGTSSKTILDGIADLAPDSNVTDFTQSWENRLYQAFRYELRPVPSANSLLDGLSQRQVRFCVASSSSLERLDLALECLNLRSRVQNVFSAEQVKQGKPAPDLFLFAADSLGVSPSRCLVVEDSPYGVQAARTAGMTCLGFVGGSHLEGIRGEHASHLVDAGADSILLKLTEILSMSGRT